MTTLLEIFLLLVILASFFLAYMSAKSWRIYMVVLGELVLLSAAVFMYMAVRTLKTQKSWREAEIAWGKAVDQQEAKNQEIESGKEERNRLVEAGIEQLKRELHHLVNDRGLSWTGNADKVTEAGVCQVSIERPDTHEIVPKTVLFVFDDALVEGGANGGHYLGEFRVTKAQAKNKTIEIEPNLPLTEEQTARLKRTSRKWTLYAMMPVDNAELFAGMEPAERQKLLPKTALQEFADKDRTLRDYEFFFHEYTVDREMVLDAMDKTKTDLERTIAAEQKAQGEITYRKTEKANLAADLEKFRYERTVITKYAQTLQDKAKGLHDELKASLAATARDAALLVELQTKAAEEINRRTADQASNDRPPAAPGQ